jgi:RNA-directed DNA polymerase
LLIDALNPIITGWTNYHQSAVSSQIFSKLDSRIWNMLWHWAKRRHPEKSKHWIADKYWHTVGNRKWVFSTKNKQLKFLSDTKIKRHRKLKLEMNPYIDNEYFVLRKLKQRFKKLTGKVNEVCDRTNNLTKLKTETLTDSCCPI